MSEDEKDPPQLHSIPGGEPIDRRKLPRRSGRVTFELYERMAIVYLAGNRSIKGLCRDLKEFGVQFRTAKKAIETGWPENKWPSLRSRAELHDKIHATSNNAGDSKRMKAALDWLEMRSNYLTIAGGLRAGIARAIVILNKNMDGALATQIRPVRQVHHEEILDAKGRVVRRVPRTLTVDVTMAPSIFDLATAWNQLASALERTGGGEIGQIMAKPPAGATGKRGHGLTDEQLRHVAETGELPEGVTPEMLGDL